MISSARSSAVDAIMESSAAGGGASSFFEQAASVSATPARTSREFFA
jgi:hypothetical protein